ncbi:MAG: sel1 repeat family protein, partial [Gammaproteobacteria bacterium]
MPHRSGAVALGGLVLLAVVGLGWAGDRDSAAELRLIRQQAERGDTGDQLLYGLALIEGRYGLRPDAAKGMPWIRRAAEGGDAYAALVLGNAYALGRGVPKDPAKAIEWWRKAAEKENAEAEYHLGKAYMDGFGVAKDPRKAGYWLRRAADHDSPDAQYLLGRMHHEGVIVEPDQETALDWLRRAAANGHRKAVHLLKVIESWVRAATPLAQERYEALHQRAIENDPHAQYELALRYESGALDVNADPKKALFWFERAARNGNVLAMHRLARAY